MTREKRRMHLQALAAAAGDLLAGATGELGTTVTGLAYDSRAVARGDLFFCIPGALADGHQFARAAASNGAAALVVERPLRAGVPEIVVGDARRAMGRLSSAFYGDPGGGMLLLGVTGTNGKTTTAFLLESILAAGGHTTGLIGTIETRVAGVHKPGVRTTPESLDLQRLFAQMRDVGVSAVAMEVTSHALALHRVEGVRFASAAFTNLSQDHLDFHADMDDYFEAKRSLFVPERAARGAANLDDPYGVKLAAAAPIPCLGYGLAGAADVRATGVELGPSGSAFTIVTPDGARRILTSFVGGFNVSNCLAAAATALQAGIGLDDIDKGLASLSSVPGRFEAVDAGQPFSVVVDYAHTPDSLDNVLRAARPLAARGGGRIVCVFGCGGDRDSGKRPLMGKVAARLADVVVVTSDNPRSEDPAAIIEAIVEGVAEARPRGADAALVDRREAIATALGWARPGDVVVIAGKGHEVGQQIGEQTIPFDDRDVAGETLVRLGWADSWERGPL